MFSKHCTSTSTLATVLFILLSTKNLFADPTRTDKNDALHKAELRQPPAAATSSGLHDRRDERTLVGMSGKSGAPSRLAIGSKYKPRPGTSGQRSQSKPAVLKLVSSLGIVLILLLLLAIPLRNKVARQNRLPQGVIEVLGAVQIQGKQQELMLIRLSNKLILVNAKPAGLQTIGEISDPIEVASIVQSCGRGDKASREELTDLAPRFGADSPIA